MTTVADLRKQQVAKTPMKDIMAQPPKQRIKTLLKENSAQLAAALPRHLTIERMETVMLTACTSTPALLECYTPSLFGALIKCGQLGLEPNNALGQAYLIPFKNQKARRTDVQLVMGYRGMIELARRSGAVVSLQAQAVREGDEFEFEWGTEERLRHVPGRNRGDITHFYSYAKLKDGGVQFDVLTKEDVDRIMETTQSGGRYGPWREHYEQMGRKTMIRRLFNYLPVSIEMAQAAALDARAEGGMEQGLDNLLTDVDYQVLDADVEVPEPITDVNGEIFDTEIHVSDDDGEPVYNKDGSFRKRPQRKAAASEPEPEPEPEPESEPETQDAAPSEDDGDDLPWKYEDESPQGDDYSLE